MSLYFILVSMHVFGLIVGLGACTVTYVVSAYGMFNTKMMPKAVGVFKIISMLVWGGLFLLVASGIALCFTSSATYGDALKSKLFYLKLFLVVIETINGIFLNIVATPLLEKAVELPDFEKTPEYRKAMIIGGIGGLISATCWYSAFVLGLYIFRVLA
ncbi:MAG: hypothetical protein WCI43_03350 [Candidatus Firestonebacteria bacterium]